MPLVFCSPGDQLNRASVLAEVGTLHLEFYYLSAITNDTKYVDRVTKARYFLKGKAQGGLYYTQIHPNTGSWTTRKVQYVVFFLPVI